MEGLRRVLFLFLLLGGWISAQAGTYYVDGDFGDDAWNGQAASYVSGTIGPKKSIGAALAIANDLDQIQILGGNYSECLFITKTLSLVLSGNSSVKCLVMNGVGKRLSLTGSELSILDSLVLRRGWIDASLANLVAVPSCKVSGGAPASFVEGRLYRANTLTSVSDLYFPVGAGKDFRPVFLSFSQNTTATNRYSAQASQAALPPIGVPAGIKNISKVHYWTLRVTGSAVSSGFDIKAQYDSGALDDEVIDPVNLRLLLKYPGRNDFHNLGGTGTAKFRGTITSTVKTDTLGSLTLGNVFGGLNSLGRKEPVPRFVPKGKCVGSPVQFLDSSFSYKSNITKWSWNFGAPGNADTANVKNPFWTYTSTGPFFVTLFVTNNLGFTDSFGRWITLRPRPNSAFSSTDACFKNPQNFSDLSTAASPDTIKSRTWFLGDGNTRTQKTFTYTYAFTGSYNVRLAVVSGSGCTDTLLKKVNVFGKPAPNMAFTGICLGQGTLFQGAGGTSGDTVSGWEWYVDGAFANSSRNFSSTLTSAKNYAVRLSVISQNGCRDTVFRTLTIYRPPSARFDLDSAVPGNTGIQCFRNNRFTMKNKSVTYQGQTMTPQFFWGSNGIPGNNQFSSSEQGVLPVKLLVTSDMGCRDSMIKNYLVRDSILLKYSVATYCLPKPATFSDSSTAGSATIVSRIWRYGDGNIGTGVQSSYVYPNGGYYIVWLKVTTNEGCTDSMTQAAFVTNQPTINVSITGRNPMCPGDSVKAKVTGGNFVRWGDQDTNRVRCFSTAGKFFVNAYTSAFCSVGDSVETTILPPVYADAGPDTSLIRGRYIILKGDGGVKFEWTPKSQVSTPDSARTRVKPQTSTTYYLKVTDANGCTDTDSVRVKVIEPLFIRIPNMITPNGDGKNDAWDLREVPNVETARVTIFSSTGEVVYVQESGWDHTWSGTGTNGDKLKSGTYMFVIEVPTEKEPFKGYLQIMR
ncbi:MAG: gliding motility-associated C-terminal domain-containing protein [Bacteroidetes bacterium]|nr:gliding motility-associated C-terminal domain-containing protein [Bacteroidota bacterium]